MREQEAQPEIDRSDEWMVIVVEPNGLWGRHRPAPCGSPGQDVKEVQDIYAYEAEGHPERIYSVVRKEDYYASVRRD